MEWAVEHANPSTQPIQSTRPLTARRKPAAESDPVQRSSRPAGNQETQALLRAGVLQAKLAVSHPRDAAEREADAMAERVMATPARCCSEHGPTEPCATCRQSGASSPHAGNQAVQRSVRGRGNPRTGDAPRSVERVLRSEGRPLDTRARAFFEPRFGRSFEDVRVHTDRAAQESARSIQAHAYAAGEHLVFDAGQFAPDTDAGKRLLAHELTHVVQQEASPRAVQRQFAFPFPLDEKLDPNATPESLYESSFGMIGVVGLDK